MAHSEENHNPVNDLEEASPDFPGEAPSPEAQGTSTLEALPTQELEKRLAAKQEEAKSLQDKYLRLAAEFDNYKKLALRDQREHVRFGNERLLKELLPVIDNLERAVESGKGNAGGEALMEGVQLTLKQAFDVLEKFGVKRIPSIGEPFDPACHQAVACVESDTVPENSVVDEFQRGYYLHDRVLRAAMVSVAGPSASRNSESGTDTEAAKEQTGATQESPSDTQA